MAKDPELRDTLSAALDEYWSRKNDGDQAAAGRELAGRVDAALNRGVDFRRVREAKANV